jgi:type I restriction enzyme R subunit
MGSDQNGQSSQNSDGQGQVGHDKPARDRAAADNIGRTAGGNFAFLRAGWPDIYDEALHAERLIHHDPRTACFYARRAIEITARWMYDKDSSLSEPYK